MATYLNVPYAEKDDAKKLGARWDPQAKHWYVPDGLAAEPFSRWLPAQVDDGSSPYIYLVFAKRECWRCKKETEIVAFGVPYHIDYLEANDDGYAWDVEPESVSIGGPPRCLPAEIRAYLEKRCNFKKAYSKTTQESSLSNNCNACGALQGDFFLFSEPDSPFFVCDPEELEVLEFVRVPVPMLWVTGVNWTEVDGAIFQYAQDHHRVLDLGVCEQLIF